MRLIDADALMDYTYNQKSRTIDCNDIARFPTAYSVDKVVEELKKIRAKETCNKEKCDTKEICRICVVDDAIEIVNQGAVRNNRKDCEYRHDNGNCLKVGGFCTAVDIKHCEKLKQGAVSDDVCEWRIVDIPHNFPIYNTSCGKIKLQYATGVDIYCNGCGKKIKIVGD